MELPRFPNPRRFPRLPRSRLIAPRRIERILRTHDTEIQGLIALPFARATHVRCVVSVSGVRVTITAEHTVVNDWGHDGLGAVPAGAAGGNPRS